MENNTKKSKAIPVMIIISLIIIVLSVVCSVAVYQTLIDQIGHGSGESLVVEGVDIVPIVGGAGKAGAAVVSGVIAAIGFAAVALQWIVYAIVRLVKSSVQKITPQQ